MEANPQRTCRLVTLGCKVNQYETQHVKEALELNGYREAAEHEPADLCVVNTCTVTMEGDAKSRQTIRRLHRGNPSAAIVVMGCYATRDPDAVRRLPGVTHVIEGKDRLPEAFTRHGVAEWPRTVRRFDGHLRAFVKVQDGCMLHCSFCIIPSVRPTVRSRSIDDIAAEVAQLVESGKCEIVLTGIHLGHYGIDLSRGKPKSEWSRLWHLLRRLDALPGDFRIRLSSLEAAEARDDLIAAMADCPRVVPHLHLCLQSGSDAVLRRMNRRYTQTGFLMRCERIRAALPLPALSTDIIVGFPGETEADFAATCRVAEEAGLSRIHVFSYSPRRGTPAAELPDRVAPAAIAERRDRLLGLENQLSARYQQSLVGQTLDVLVEGADAKRPGQVVGLSCRYVSVRCGGYAPALQGRRVPVRVVAADGDGLLAEPLAGDSVNGRTALPVLH